MYMWDKARFGVRNSDAVQNYATSGSGLADSGWHHMVGVRDTYAGTLAIYVDGSLHGLTSDPGGSILNNRVIKIGKYYGGSAWPFDGLIDDVRIYNRSLRADEIAELYWSVFPDPQDDTTEGEQGEVSGTGSDPVNTATGSFFHQETDLSIPSRGSPLVFTRYYNSKAAAPGRKAAKSGQAAQRHKTAASQPASTVGAPASMPESTTSPRLTKTESSNPRAHPRPGPRPRRKANEEHSALH